MDGAGDADGDGLVVMTFNIRNGRGHDDRVDLGRVADVIAAASPDVVALQEVDAGQSRSGGVDQAKLLALRLGMEAHFAACIADGSACYGIATLVRGEVLDSRTLVLPHRAGWRSEPRRALAVGLRHAGRRLEVVNTHLSLLPAERGAQAGWLAAELGRRADGHVLLAGDLNCVPGSAGHRALARALTPVRAGGRTWPARLPLLALDHIFHGAGLRVSGARAVRSALARVASDHLPVVATVRIDGAAAPTNFGSAGSS